MTTGYFPRRSALHGHFRAAWGRWAAAWALRVENVLLDEDAEPWGTTTDISQRPDSQRPAAVLGDGAADSESGRGGVADVLRLPGLRALGSTGNLRRFRGAFGGSRCSTLIRPLEESPLKM